MELNELLNQLNSLNIKIRVEGDQLRLNAPAGVLTAELKQALKDSKPELVALLQQSNPVNQQEVDLPVIEPDWENRHEPFPLTDVQHAYWLGRGSSLPLGNVSTHFYVELEGENLDIERVGMAWNQVIRRHDMLRSIVLANGTQRVLPDVPDYKIQTADVRGQSANVFHTTAATFRSELSHQVLPSDQWPLFEIRVIQFDTNKSLVNFSIDVLIIDAAGVIALLNEWSTRYRLPHASFTPLDLSFRDYVLCERKMQEREKYESAKKYWFDRLGSLPPPPDLPLALNPATIDQPTFNRRRGVLSKSAWRKLQEAAKRRGLTSSGLLLGVFSYVLAAWSKSPSFTINLTLFNRQPLHAQVAEILGDFTSLTLLEVNQSADLTFAENSLAIQKQLWTDLDHRHISGIEVLREANRVRGAAPGSVAIPVVFTSALGLGAIGDDELTKHTLGREVYGISQTPQVWLDHQVFEFGGELNFNWDTVDQLFPAGLLDCMFAAYENMLQELLRNEHSWDSHGRSVSAAVDLKPLPLQLVPGRQELLHSGFAAMVHRYPNNAAVITANRSFSYAQLHQYCSAVASQIVQRDCGQFVAVVMEKGWEQIIGVISALMAGKAYIPLDASWPYQRINFVLEQADVTLVLTQSHLLSALRWPAGVDCVVVGDPQWQDADVIDLPDQVCNGELAYIIYTSGSTGQPKGVTIDHRGAVNTLKDINERFSVIETDRVLALSSLCFDLSVYDIFGILSAGGAVVVPDSSQEREPDHWHSLIESHAVTVWNTVPALMQMYTDTIKFKKLKVRQPLRLVMLSGDWLPVALPDKIRNCWPAVDLYSLGGATEASIWSIYYPVKTVDPAWKSIPYGWSMRNQEILVLDHAFNRRPPWVPGDLYIRGIGLAKGYFGDDVKTKTSFVTHPKTRETLYKTGDLGRYFPDGSIEFLGREDFQVKINGYRVELGEIESAIRACDGVENAMVIANGGSTQQKQLVAYVVPEAGLLEETVPDIGLDWSKFITDGTANLIIDPAARDSFKLERRGRLNTASDQSRISLPNVHGRETRDAYIRRKSYRRYLPNSVTADTLGQLLELLRGREFDGYSGVKFRYPSASSLYPVQVYLKVKLDRVAGFDAGVYYYDPYAHELVRVPGDNINSTAFGPNGDIYQEAAFCLFFIGKLEAIRPLYGQQLARDFCLIEAGNMGQLLSTEAVNLNIGLCAIGAIDQSFLAPAIAVDGDHVFLSAYLGGCIDPLWCSEFPAGSSEGAMSAEATVQSRALQSSGVLDGKVIQDSIAGSLPRYMLPSAYMFIPEIPLTSNGKLDRSALPEPGEATIQVHTEYLAPRSPLEFNIVQICRDALHLERMGVRDNFFELGMNSVAAVQLMASVEQELDVQVPLSALFEDPTVERLASVIQEALDGKETKQALPIIAIQHGTDSDYPPLFLIHPVGGNVMCYLELARYLGKQQTVFAIQSPALIEADSIERLESMATYYIKLVRAEQPVGPYQLAGWSMGGVIAYEMARQLTRQGQTVEFLGLIDSHAPMTESMRLKGLLTSPAKLLEVFGGSRKFDDAGLLLALFRDMSSIFGKGVQLTFDELNQVPHCDRIDYVLEKSKHLGLLSPQVGRSVMERIHHVFRLNLEAKYRYRAKTYNGVVHLYRATEQSSNDLVSKQEVDYVINDAKLGWGRLADKVQVCPVVGDHYSIVRSKHAQVLAQLMTSHMRRSDAPLPGLAVQAEEAIELN